MKLHILVPLFALVLIFALILMFAVVPLVSMNLLIPLKLRNSYHKLISTGSNEAYGFISPLKVWSFNGDRKNKSAKRGKCQEVQEIGSWSQWIHSDGS